MGKKKKRNDTRWSIDDKYANARLSKINSYMDEIKSLIGKRGDGVNGGAKTLIGCVEGLNNEAKDGKALSDAYNKFNNTTLVNIQKRLKEMDSNFEWIDKIAK